MTLWEPLRDAVLSARNERVVDKPSVAASDGGDVDMVEVGAYRWPRRADARVEVIETRRAALEREGTLEIDRLKAMVGDAVAKRDTRRREFDASVQELGKQLVSELKEQLVAALVVSWPKFCASGSPADAAAVMAHVMHAEQREVLELGTTSCALACGTFALTVSATPPMGSAPHGLLEACERAMRLVRGGGAAVALVAALAEVAKLSVR